jgi:ATP-dependent Lon protease
MPGKGVLTLTGNLGAVMKESCQAALSYIRSHSDDFGLAKDLFSKIDIHVHVPEGATPKDGPSAGAAITTAMVSALTKKPVDKYLAMTGEITLRGRVLPIGGLKEKCLAAQRLGISTVLYPKANEADMDEILQNTPLTLKLIPVSTMDEVLPYILENYKIENRMSRVSAGIEIAKETTPRGKMPPRTSPPQHTLL